jgi:hypothetical protein
MLPLIPISKGLMLPVEPFQNYKMLSEMFLSTRCNLVLRVDNPMGCEDIMLGEVSPQFPYELNSSHCTCQTMQIKTRTLKIQCYRQQKRQ